MQATTHELMDIFRVASELIISFVEFQDEVVWKKTDNGQFAINSCFTSILVPNQFDWVKIWFISRVGKHFISAWMAILNGLKTKDVLSHRNVHTDSLCALCCREPETLDHLFSSCSWSSQIWSCILSKFKIVL